MDARRKLQVFVIQFNTDVSQSLDAGKPSRLCQHRERVEYAWNGFRWWTVAGFCHPTVTVSVM